MTLLIVLLIIFGIPGFLIYNAAKRDKKYKQALIDLGVKKEDLIATDKYVAGHPEINTAAARSCIISVPGNFNIYSQPIVNSVPKLIGQIPKNDIKNIVVEDASTVERRFTTSTVGGSTFVIPRTRVNELSYLTITWNDGRFDHSTYFQYSGSKAMDRANTTRNRLINSIK